MFLIYGNARVGQGIVTLLQRVGLQKGTDRVMVDYSDYHEQLCHDARLIIASPGIKPDHPIYSHHRDNVVGELTFLGYRRNGQLADSLPARPRATSNDERNASLMTIGVTGSKGKSSTTSMIAHALDAIEQLTPSPRPVIACGNNGISLSSTLAEHRDTPHLTLVIETSSFMLWHMREWSFHRGVWTNFAADHLDRHIDLDDYWQAKYQLPSTSVHHFWHHTSLHARLTETIDDCGSRHPDTNNKHRPTRHMYSPLILPTVPAEMSDISNMPALQAPMNHNLAATFQVSVAYAGLRAVEAEWQHARRPTMRDWQPLPHRMTTILTDRHGVTWIDDGFATNSHAHIVSLENIRARDPHAVLIVGGYDKGESRDDNTNLITAYDDFRGHIVLIGETTEKCAQRYDHHHISHHRAKDMADAVQYAATYCHANKVSIVALSPAAASFDMYDNASAKADDFVRLVQTIAE